MKYLRFLFLILIAGCAAALPAQARDFNDRIQNMPYADMRRVHLGFSVGMFCADLAFTHNGYITPEGEAWRMEQPGYQPGLTVTGPVIFPAVHPWHVFRKP